ncbi:MAG: energy transducer TonB [Planctomycetota bacterium]|jgi:outer membrane biosynthesis protein TonB
MRPRLSTLTLVAGFVVSLLLHGTVLLPSLVSMMKSTSPRPGRLHARFDPDSLRRRDNEQTPPLQLGIDAETPSTLTWIGYDQYREHLAALAETEQAAFTSQAGGSPAPAPSGGPSSPPEEIEPERAATEAAQAADPLAALESILDSLETAPIPQVPRPTSTPSDGKALLDVLAKIEASLSKQAEPARIEPAEKPDEPVAPAPTDDQRPDEGEPADRESDATSTLEVPFDQIKLGKPIAAPGLVVKPRRPSFTTLVRFTAVPANPQVEIRFRRDGRPGQARILKSSGDSRVDEAILNSLYRWRASGKRLEALTETETVKVRIRIMLF